MLPESPIVFSPNSWRTSKLFEHSTVYWIEYSKKISAKKSTKNSVRTKSGLSLFCNDTDKFSVKNSVFFIWLQKSISSWDFGALISAEFYRNLFFLFKKIMRLSMFSKYCWLNLSRIAPVTFLNLSAKLST
jgi:hypothetical protein